MKNDFLLAVIPSSRENQRLTVVLVRGPDGSSQVSLRQQTWAETIGWFDQRSVELEPEQVRQLRAVLGTTPGRVPVPLSAEQPATIPFPGGPQVESA